MLQCSNGLRGGKGRGGGGGAGGLIVGAGDEGEALAFLLDCSHSQHAALVPELQGGVGEEVDLFSEGSADVVAAMAILAGHLGAEDTCWDVKGETLGSGEGSRGKSKFDVYTNLDPVYSLVKPWENLPVSLYCDSVVPTRVQMREIVFTRSPICYRKRAIIMALY